MSEEVKHHIHESPYSMAIPLLILALLSVIGGYIGIPAFMGKILEIHDSNLFDEFLGSSIFVKGVQPEEYYLFGHWTLVEFSTIAAFLGIVIAIFMYLIKPSLPETLAKAPVISALYRGSYAKWFVDEIYGVAFIRTFIVLSKDLLWANLDVTIIDGAVNGVGSIARGAATLLRTAQAGILRFYAALMALGAVAILIYIVVSARF